MVSRLTLMLEHQKAVACDPLLRHIPNPGSNPQGLSLNMGL